MLKAANNPVKPSKLLTSDKSCQKYTILYSIVPALELHLKGPKVVAHLPNETNLDKPKPDKSNLPTQTLDLFGNTTST